MRSALYEWPFVMHLLWEFRCIRGYYGIGGRGRFRCKTARRRRTPQDVIESQTAARRCKSGKTPILTKRLYVSYVNVPRKAYKRQETSTKIQNSDRKHIYITINFATTWKDTAPLVIFVSTVASSCLCFKDL